MFGRAPRTTINLANERLSCYDVLGHQIIKYKRTDLSARVLLITDHFIGKSVKVKDIAPIVAVIELTSRSLNNIIKSITVKLAIDVSSFFPRFSSNNRFIPFELKSVFKQVEFRYHSN